MWIPPVTPEEQMLPVYAWFTPGAQLGVVMEDVCARSRAARPGAVLHGTALVQPGSPPARGFLALVLSSPILSLFPIWPVLPWLGGNHNCSGHVPAPCLLIPGPSLLPPLPHTYLWDSAAEGCSSPGRCSARMHMHCQSRCSDMCVRFPPFGCVFAFTADTDAPACL